MIPSEFDQKASEWDKNPMHIERSIAIASAIKEFVPLKKSMKALEYGAGTGLLSFELRNEFQEIVLMDSSAEMIRICGEKAKNYGTNHIKPLHFDLEHNSYHNGKFDIIYSLLVFHHISNTETVIGKFREMLNPGGFLLIADLYPEDGSFHNPDVLVHKGFNPEALSSKLINLGFKNPSFRHSYTIRKEDGRDYPVFILKSVRN